MRKSSKKTLEKRGVFIAGRAPNAPGTSEHKDKRNPQRQARKIESQKQIQLETARNRGPFSIFPVVASHFKP